MGIIVRCCALLLGVGALAMGARGAGGAEPPVVAVRAPHATLWLEVARSEAARARGLMGRRRLAPHHGMLFVFQRDAMQYFWMKDTLVPLDMLFVSGKGVVTLVAARVPVAPPGTADARLPRRQGRGRYVIELPQGKRPWTAYDSAQICAFRPFHEETIET